MDDALKVLVWRAVAEKLAYALGQLPATLSTPEADRAAHAARIKEAVTLYEAAKRGA